MLMQWKTFAVALALVSVAAPALADALDGDWCHPKDGRRLTIRGPEVVTPGGKTMKGDYGRHTFSYVVPAPEPGAGETMFMVQINEERAQVRIGAEGATEVWRRCSPSISALRAPVSG